MIVVLLSHVCTSILFAIVHACAYTCVRGNWRSGNTSKNSGEGTYQRGIFLVIQSVIVLYP